MPESGRAASGRGSGALSPIFVTSNSGNPSMARACSVAAHCSAVRTRPAQAFRATIACSSSAPRHVETARATPSGSLEAPSSETMRSRWCGKLQWR